MNALAIFADSGLRPVATESRARSARRKLRRSDSFAIDEYSDVLIR